MKRVQKNSAGIVISGVFFTRALWGIALLGALLRLAVAMELAPRCGSVFHPSVYSDLNTYMQLGSEIARGNFPKEFYYQPWYYAVFLPVIYLVSGFSLRAVVIVQSLIGGATAGIAGIIGCRLFGRTAGLAAALFTALSTPLLLYAPFHQNETLQAFHLTLLFALLLWARRKNSLLCWGIVGLAAGISILTRGQIWLLLPVLLAGLFSSFRLSRKQKAAGCALFFAGLLVIQLPFILHNSRARGRLTGPSTAADAVLALGNTPEAPPGGRNADLPAGPMEYPESFHRYMANSAKGVSVARQMLRWMAEEPAAFFELQFRKILLFWDARELPNNVSLAGEGRYSHLLQLPSPGRSGFLLTFAIGGFFLLLPGMFRKHNRDRLLLAGFILFYWGATAAFYNLSRFRAPILPLASLFAGAMVTKLLALKRAPRESRLLRLLALTAGAFFTFGAYEFYAGNWESSVMRFCRPHGTRVDSGGPDIQVLDHGPFTCGDWRQIELKRGMVISKKFSVKEPVSGTVRWSVCSPESGMLEFRCEGKVFRKEVKPGISVAEFPVTSPQCQMEILNFPAGSSAPLDFRREYGRSGVDGKILPGEWIMRFVYKRP